MTMQAVFTGSLPVAEAAAIRRGAERGEWKRLCRGAYVLGNEWAAASRPERHRALVTSFMRVHGSALVVTDRSAVAMHRLPWIGDFGPRIVVADAARDRGQVGPTVQRRGSAGRLPQTTTIDDVAVGSLAETAVDVALHEHPWRAIAVLDAVLRRGVDKDSIRLVLSDRRARDHRRAAELIDAADGRAESPGESITRWGGHVLGAPDPVLQQEFRHDGVLADRVDLWYPDQRVIVEFDGRQKYDAAPGDALWDEKRREDRLRRRPEVRGLTRVTWADAMPAGQLPRLLADGGIPLADDWGSAWRSAALRAF